MAGRPKAAALATTPLKPPPDGAVVRMYRIGHGDCFLIAFAGERPERPTYVLIDCGYKPGSPNKLSSPTKAKEVGADIIAVTGGIVDVAIVTHEHQDHVNALSVANFPGLKIGKVWFAWTENPKDDVANALRKKFNDRLLGLIDARANSLGVGQTDIADRIADFLELELGEGADGFNGRQHLPAAGKDPARSANKIAMTFLRDCSQSEPDYLYPHGKSRQVPGAANVRVFVLGPPRDVEKIDDLDPIGEERFGDYNGVRGMGLDGQAAVSGTKTSPFSRRHVRPLEQAFADQDFDDFFSTHYGADNVLTDDAADGEEIPTSAAWRRLAKDDATDAGALALAMNNATNNASLVLAFELSKGGKVLLFVGDAQAGNWRSWSEASFNDEGKKVTAKDLLGRTVLYKVGHHGSHNATLNGRVESKQANLSWMAQGQYAEEFVAMITAVEKWAHQKPKPDWNHPLPSIKKALLEKAGGRVLQTDTGLQQAVPVGVGVAGWQSFLGRVTESPLYFDLTIEA
jgi:hypothetical protein